MFTEFITSVADCLIAVRTQLVDRTLQFEITRYMYNTKTLYGLKRA